MTQASAAQAPARWRILADDLTGALDTVATLGHAEGVPVYLGMAASHAACTAPFAALSTGTRDQPPHELHTQLALAALWLADAGLSYKKVDSLLRGNTFAELAVVMRTQDKLTRMVFAPAYPAQGRFTADDQHWIGLPHNAGRGLATQYACSSLVAAFAAVGLKAQSGRTLADCGDAQVMIPQVLTDADLDAIAAARLDPHSSGWLWAGSAGLAAALARAGGMPAVAPDATTRANEAHTRNNRQVALITCSRHPVLRAQLKLLQTHYAASFTQPGHLALNAAASGPLVLDLSPEASISPQDADNLLEQQAAHITRQLPPPGTLLVIGGDTLLALCRTSGATHLTAWPSTRPGWGRARLNGGLWHGVECLSRSGAFGAPDDLLSLMNFITPPAPATPKDTSP